MPKHSAILWPDHNIGKRESRRIRDAHNALYNDFHVLLAVTIALKSCLENWVEIADKEDKREYDDKAIADADAIIKKVTT